MGSYSSPEREFFKTVCNTTYMVRHAATWVVLKQFVNAIMDISPIRASEESGILERERDVKADYIFELTPWFHNQAESQTEIPPDPPS
eukprot:1968632-Pyramimonas_sp.AAC.1